jgi:ribosomal protein L34
MKLKLRVSNHKKAKMSGFRTRNKTSKGKKIIAARRRKGRKI